VILFLDFDGVVANGVSAKNKYYMRTTLHKDRSNYTTSVFTPSTIAYDLDRECVHVLNRLVQFTSAKVVISSTWRTTFSQKDLEEHLGTFGFVGDVLGVTPCKMSLYWRDEEVRMWMEDNKYTGDYLVIDDENHHLRHCPKDNFVYIKHGWRNGGLKSNRAKWELTRVLKQRGMVWAG